MTDETCEGFSNYETFSVAVVVDNDQSSHHHARALVWEYEASGSEPWNIAEHVKDYYEAQMPEDLPTFWGSLLRAGWDRVDWMELVDHFRDPEWRAAQDPVVVTCRYCHRVIVQAYGGVWIDPAATGDDAVWRETCDAHDTFTAEHVPESA